MFVLNLSNAFLDLEVAFYGRGGKVPIPNYAYTFGTLPGYLAFISNKNLILLIITISSYLATTFVILICLWNVKKQAATSNKPKQKCKLCAFVISHHVFDDRVNVSCTVER